MIKVSSLELDMSLQKKIEDKLSEALKKKDKNVFSTLRLVISAIKDAAIANRTKGKEMNDSDITQILKKMVKQRNDSCEAYKKAGRKDLLEVENKEIEVIKAFLPKQLSEEETKKICKEIIQSLGASSLKDMGKIMGALKQKYSDSIDFSKVNIIVKGLLNQ